jgi:hypothetical protein
MATGDNFGSPRARLIAGIVATVRSSAEDSRRAGNATRDDDRSRGF